MEKSQELATESFSYSWLTDTTPRVPPNLRRIEDDDNFRFDVPSSTDFVNADEIFSEGQIMPVYAGRSPRTEAAAASVPVRNRYYYILAKWRRSSKKILHKCLGFLHLHRRIGCSRNSSRVDDLQRKVLEASPRRSSSAVDFGFDSGQEYYCLKIDKNNWTSYPTSISPCRSIADAHDNSISEAILYCKRSIEN